jgi:predicted kinase
MDARRGDGYGHPSSAGDGVADILRLDRAPAEQGVMKDPQPVVGHGNLDPQTLLVIVSGAPGSGKSTLARRLADEIGAPVLVRDDLKEILLDTLGAEDREASNRLGVASYALLHRLLNVFVGRVSRLVVESNFTRGLAEPELAPLLSATIPVQLHCRASESEVVRRIEARAGSDERHPGHFDAVALPGVMRRFADGAFDPLHLLAPLLSIDTTTGYEPGWPSIIRFVRRYEGRR